MRTIPRQPLQVQQVQAQRAEGAAQGEGEKGPRQVHVLFGQIFHELKNHPGIEGEFKHAFRPEIRGFQAAGGRYIGLSVFGGLFAHLNPVSRVFAVVLRLRVLFQLEHEIIEGAFRVPSG